MTIKNRQSDKRKKELDRLIKCKFNENGIVRVDLDVRQKAYCLKIYFNNEDDLLEWVLGIK